MMPQVLNSIWPLCARDMKARRVRACLHAFVCFTRPPKIRWGQVPPLPTQPLWPGASLDSLRPYMPLVIPGMTQSNPRPCLVQVVEQSRRRLRASWQPGRRCCSVAQLRSAQGPDATLTHDGVPIHLFAVEHHKRQVPGLPLLHVLSLPVPPSVFPTRHPVLKISAECPLTSHSQPNLVAQAGKRAKPKLQWPDRHRMAFTREILPFALHAVIITVIHWAMGA